MSRAIRWNPQPTSRLLQVFDRRRRCVGAWDIRAKSKALVEFAKHPRGYMLVVDEYTATLPHLGHCYRVVVEEVVAS